MLKKFLKSLIVTIITFEARIVLSKYKPKIIAITGSVGKTSTKDAVATVLSKRFVIRKSNKSFNSELGVPLTILGLPNGWSNPFIWLKIIFQGLFLCLPNSFQLRTFNYPLWLILEIGADRPGDIEKICKWLKPDITIITHFGKVPAHVEFFSSQKELIREKSFLVKALKESGILILNNDDEDVRSLKDLRRDCRVLTISINHESDYQASNIETTCVEQNGFQVPIGISFRVNYAGNSVPIYINGGLGKQHIYPVLFALSLGNSLGLNMVEMANGISEHKTPPGRMKIVDGIKASTIIDDTYNASPIAMTEALRTLKELKTLGKKIAVLGDMLELGKHSESEHIKIGKEARASCDILITVGIRGRDIAKGAQDNGMDEKFIFQFDTSEEAAIPVKDLIQLGDILLVKASQGIRMEKIVEEIMAKPEMKEELLVRQEPEWSDR